MQAKLTIDIKNLVANYAILANQNSTSSCAAVVKADAYGLGAAHVGPALENAGCRTFFTAFLDEAIELRQSLQNLLSRIFVLSGLFKGQEQTFLNQGLCPVLNDPGQAELWLRALSKWSEKYNAMPNSQNCALHLDTGMSRLGFAPPDLEKAHSFAQRFQRLGQTPLLLSHLSSAEQPNSPSNAIQLARLKAALEGFDHSLPVSFANSSGIFRGSDYHFQLLRPGYALYGGNPTPGQKNPMLPVATLKAPILQTRDIEFGQSVGYNEAWMAKEPTRLATLGLGYADGLHRQLFETGSAFSHGQALPFVGKVSMDAISIDMSASPQLKVGDWVEIIGPNQSLEDLGAAAGTIGYEILTSLGQRYKRTYLA